jgi:hypothetical protein
MFLLRKDVVFLDGDVILDRSIYTNDNDKKYLSLYVANGNLRFTSDIIPEDLRNIDNNGNPNLYDGVTKGIYLVGNFIVNGLVVGDLINENKPYASYKTIPFKTFIHGKFISLNTFTTVSMPREKQISNLLSTRFPTYQSIVRT